MSADEDAAWFAEYRERLAARGYDIDGLDRRADEMARLPASGLAAALRAFDEILDLLPNESDSDYGALLLEHVADGCADAERARALYSAALGRAGKYASWATAGGEGLARMRDVNRIQGKLSAA